MTHRNILPLLLALLCLPRAHAQDGRLPPVLFRPGALVCDTAPWQVVFYDGFDGDTLSQSWIRFNSWAGMPGGDHDDWPEARPQHIWQGANKIYTGIYRDENVIVGNGTCKLLTINAPDTWKCATCDMQPVTAPRTYGRIALPFTGNYFNNGRFELRARFPTKRYAHSCAWLWFGSSVNEIDIVEAYGNSARWPANNRRTTYSLHSWPPPGENPYGLAHHEVVSNFPGPARINRLFGNHFDAGAWHTYVCEWDTAVVRFYCDGQMISEQWKYYRTGTYRPFYAPWSKVSYQAGSGCNPAPGAWQVMNGFPYNNRSHAQLRITSVSDDPNGPSTTGPAAVCEIDYVCISQRHPAAEGRKPLQGQPTQCRTAVLGSTD